ncbi:hypothetical protein [Neolewinella sp.]|uniref:hypothetical protein n=1 Tax=Neolewinella sp. TaxID=2993543 RepID=UPI003B525EEF
MHTRFTLLLLLTVLLLPLLAQQEIAQPVLLNEGARVNLYFLSDAENGADSLMATDGGAPVYLLKGERGQHESRQVLLQVLPDGSAEPSATLTGGEGFDQIYNNSFEIIETGQPVTRHWLQPGAILGLHHVRLKPGTDQAAFERFIHNMWSPTQSDALPDSKIIFLRGISGERSGDFSFMWLIDSGETREYYFPQAGKPSQIYQDFERGWAWINDDDNLGKYVDDTQGDEYTDFIVVR